MFSWMSGLFAARVTHFAPEPPAPSVRIDQERSLVQTLGMAGVAHGDDVDVELTGVGVTTSVPGIPMLSFCPARAQLLAVHTAGSATERLRPIPPVVTLETAAAKTVEDLLKGKRGFAHLQARILTNGSIHIKELRLNGFEPVDLQLVTRGDSYELYRQQQQQIVA